MQSEAFLQDENFLKQIDNLRVKQQYVRLTVLSWSEEPISEIQGRAMPGSTISLDGTSSLRRTSNFQMFAEEKENDLTRIDQDLAINRKVKIELGVLNTVPDFIYQTIEENTNLINVHTVNYREKYGDIVWFPLGIYVLFDPQISHQTNGVTINVQLKDKMCLLNGDAGGVIPAAVTLSDKEDEYGVITHPVVEQIIRELVTHFGQENPSKIIIEDLDEKAKKVMKYIGNNPLYYLENHAGEETTREFYLQWDAAVAAARNEGLTQDEIKTYEYGDAIGYVLTELVYPGELSCNPGDSVCSVLDQIVQVLGNFEYFYDVFGNFHFREIKNYLNISQSYNTLKNLKDNPNYDVDFSSGKSVYSFEGTKLITATSNAPSYSNVKNDFIVWGVRKSADGETEIPVRYHLAIDHKPKVGQQHYVNFYEDSNGITRAGAEFTFEYKDLSQLPEKGAENTLYIIGSLADRKYYRWDTKNNEYYSVRTSDCLITSVDWREELYYEGIEAQELGSDYPYYFTELLNEWPKLFNLRTQQFYDSVNKSPSEIDFWLDMIDDDAEVGQYCIDNLGRRSLVIQEDGLNCVFEDEIPDLVFININQTQAEIQQERDDCDALGQDWVQVDDTIFALLAVGGTQNSCYERIKDLIYQYTDMNESISITSLPIYYLEPNSRITVRDDASGINGDYMITSMNLPLGVDGTMTINAYKCKQKI